MYKVLIVDDEKIVRIALKSIILWEAAGFHICDAASNAKNALSIIENQKPNIVITDVEMPSMNGIELIKAAKEKGYKGEWIILTNHENFNYAKEAIQLNVFDYVVKTDISKEIINKLLGRVKQKLDSLHINQYEVEESEIKKDALLLGSNIDQDEFFLDKGYVLFFIFLENGFKARTTNLLNIINETIKEYRDGLVELDPQSILLLIDKEKYFEFFNEMEDIALKISSMINLYMNSNCSFVVSPSIDKNTNIISLINQSKEVKNYSFFLGYGKIFPIQKFKQFSKNDLSFYNEYKELVVLINKYSFDKAIFIVNEWFDGIQRICPKISKVNYITDCLINLLYIDYRPYLSNLKNSIQHKNNTIFEIKNSILQILKEIEKNRINFDTDMYRKEVRSIVRYIDENISTKFSLGLLASNVGLTESYLSRLFKLETNMNLINYINLKKLEKAKEHLLVRNCSVKNLSYELGFDVPTYFNKLFNNTYLISPTEYIHLVEGLDLTNSKEDFTIQRNNSYISDLKVYSN